MFRKLFALEVAALTENDELKNQPETNDNEMLAHLREVFTPRTGNYGSMWSKRSFG